MTETWPPLRPCTYIADVFGVLGKRWMGRLIDLLVQRPARCNELHAGLPALSDCVLSERLTELQELGLVEREVDAGPPITATYRLTHQGKETRPCDGRAAGLGRRPGRRRRSTAPAASLTAETSFFGGRLVWRLTDRLLRILVLDRSLVVGRVPSIQMYSALYGNAQHHLNVQHAEIRGTATSSVSVDLLGNVTERVHASCCRIEGMRLRRLSRPVGDTIPPALDCEANDIFV